MYKKHLAGLLLVLLLTGCAPHVTLSVGCGGILTSPTTIATAAHCFDEANEGVATTILGATVGVRVHEIDPANDTAVLLTDAPVMASFYGRFETPTHGVIAYSTGLCPVRVRSIFRAAYVGEIDVTNAPDPARQGLWDYWAILGNEVSCPGDSGYPYLALSPNDDGTWTYYGTTSMHDPLLLWGNVWGVPAIEVAHYNAVTQTARQYE